MEAEASAFETSQMVATFVASTPLVNESWRLCSVANTTAPMGFVTEKTGDGVGYLAFSGVQTGDSILDPNWASLVPLESAAPGLFGPLVTSRGDGEDDRKPVMVHAGLLELFMSMYRSDTLPNQMEPLQEPNKDDFDAIKAVRKKREDVELICR